jgi:hypothetical protein
MICQTSGYLLPGLDLIKLVDQRLGVLQVGGVEALGEQVTGAFGPRAWEG